MTIVPEPEWEELLGRLVALRGTALFLGRSDSGKSTLVRYLVGELAASGLPVALVDADIGQSSLGLPGTVSSRVFQGPLPPHGLRWEQLSFLGSVSPMPILSLLAAETGRRVLSARSRAAVVLVDSTGLVDGEPGRALKLAKIRATAPQLVVAVAAGQELEPILARVPAELVWRLAPSPLAKRRSPQVRSRYRHARLAEHFHGAREHLLAGRRISFFRHGAPAHPFLTAPAAGTVLGLNHDAETRALGLVLEADAGSLVVLSPLPSLRGINRVVLGDFRFR